MPLAVIYLKQKIDFTVLQTKMPPIRLLGDLGHRLVSTSCQHLCTGYMVKSNKQFVESPTGYCCHRCTRQGGGF
jgi:hypothetical protein